jgi:hypothetical protein
VRLVSFPEASGLDVGRLGTAFEYHFFVRIDSLRPVQFPIALLYINVKH